MLKKKDLDKLLTLTRKWYKEKDPAKAEMYCNQVLSLSEEMAGNSILSSEYIFSFARTIAQNRWPNEQLYILVERYGEKVEHWEYEGNFI